MMRHFSLYQKRKQTHSKSPLGGALFIGRCAFFAYGVWPRPITLFRQPQSLNVKCVFETKYVKYVRIIMIVFQTEVSIY